MTRTLKIISCMTTAFLTQACALSATAAPVAYVYVSNYTNIVGYAAASNGALTPITGSPFSGGAIALATSGSYVFAVSGNGENIGSFSVAANGAIKQVSTIQATSYNNSCKPGGNAVISLFLDHTASTLYDLEYNADACANLAYQNFTINKATGALVYHGVSNASTEFSDPLNFSSNNVYAYDTSYDGSQHFFFQFNRSSNGDLTGPANINPLLPNPGAGKYFLPYLAASDPASNMAVSLQAYSSTTNQAVGSPVMAVYSGTNTGNLTTSSTVANMPTIAVGTVTALNMSPSGKLIAIAGSKGLQVYHFNGASPITKFTGLLASVEIDQLSWDKTNHLYAVSYPSGKLYVFTVTPTGASQAPGSPYSISSPQGLAVAPK
jgi:hypothetical protein